MIFYGIGELIPFVVNSFTALMGGSVLLSVGEVFVMTFANVLPGDYFSVKTGKLVAHDSAYSWFSLQNMTVLCQ